MSDRPVTNAPPENESSGRIAVVKPGPTDREAFSTSRQEKRTFPSLALLFLRYVNHRKDNVHKLLGEPFALVITYLVLRFSSAGPNIITGLALLSGIVAALFIAVGFPLLSASFYYVSHVLDTVDGKIARYRAVGSPRGQLLDFAADSVVMMSMGIGHLLFLHNRDEAWASLLFAIYLMLFYTIDRFELSHQRFASGTKGLHLSHSVLPQDRRAWVRAFYDWRIWAPTRVTTLWIVFVIAPLFGHRLELYSLSVTILVIRLLRGSFLPTVREMIRRE